MTNKLNVINKGHIKISVPNIPEYVSIVRLTTSAIANKMRFNIEEIEDIKVAVAEACTILLENIVEYKNYDIEYDIFNDKISIVVKGDSDLENFELSKEKGLGIFIIKSLMDEVEFNNKGNYIEIKMTRKIEEVTHES